MSNTTGLDLDQDELIDTSPDTLLLDLAQNQVRALSSPMPKNPGAMGWQCMSASTMALAARLLHTLQQVAPEKAAEIADWYAGPFGDGPDLMDFTEWLDVNVARPSGADIEAWIADGRRRAVESARIAERNS